MYKKFCTIYDIYKYVDIKQFCIQGDVVSIKPHGKGLINNTFVIKTNTNKQYILQRINNNIFKNIPLLIDNIKQVQKHLDYIVKKNSHNNFYIYANKQKHIIASNSVCGGKKTDEYLDKTIHLIDTVDRKSFLKTSIGFFRVYNYIENTITYQKSKYISLFFETGRAFGKFTKMFDGFDCQKLHNTIPGFHSTKNRYNKFLSALVSDKYNRAKFVKKEIEFALSKEKYCNILDDLIEKKILPMRVVHNDTKLNNVLFDKKTKKAVAVVDLDTIMTGSLCFDFGDSIRFCCNNQKEDCKNASKVLFLPKVFDAFTNGYLQCATNLTKSEIEYLPLSSLVMTYECGLRFLTDYLQGDKYFSTSYEGHNINRVRCQFAFFDELYKNLLYMEHSVSRYAKLYTKNKFI